MAIDGGDPVWGWCEACEVGIRISYVFPIVFPWFILLLPSFPMLFDPFVDAFYPSDRQGGVATSGDRLVLGWAAEQHLLGGFNWSLAMAIMGRSCETHAKISGEWQCSWENSWGTCLFFVGNHGNTHSTTAIDVKNLEKINMVTRNMVIRYHHIIYIYIYIYNMIWSSPLLFISQMIELS